MCQIPARAMIPVERSADITQEKKGIMPTMVTETDPDYIDSIVIKTRSGEQYYYDKYTNRISYEPIGILVKNDAVFAANKVCPDIEISHFCIELTQQCNFRCKYCCYSGEYKGWRQHSKQSQNTDNIEDIISFISKYSPKQEPFSVAFYGGEVLLEFRNMMFLAHRLRNLFKNKVSFSLTSNGYLLSPNIIDEICNTSDFTLNITIDGDMKMHDANRVLSNGNGTYNKIINNLWDFRRRYPKEFDKRIGFLATLQSTLELPELNDAWMANDLLKDKLPKHVSMIVPNFSKLIRDTSLDDKLEVFYIALDHYKKGVNDVLTQQLIEITDTIRHREIFNLADIHTVSTCLTNIESCFIDCNGDIAACEKVCDSFRIGNIVSGIDRQKLEKYNTEFVLFQNKNCKKCWAQRLCNICLKHLEYSKSEMEYICQKEKEFALLSLIMFCEIVELEDS